jgi:hypothetical protein
MLSDITLLVIMLNVIILNVIMRSVFILSVFMLCVVILSVAESPDLPANFGLVIPVTNSLAMNYYCKKVLMQASSILCI